MIPYTFIWVKNTLELKILIHILEKNLDKVNWDFLSSNENAISILEKNLDKINWSYISGNKKFIQDKRFNIEQHLDDLDWEELSYNINAMPLLEKNIDKIDWDMLLYNPSLFDIDYIKMSKMRTNIIYQELISVVFHPDKVDRMLEYHESNGGSVEDFEYV